MRALVEQMTQMIERTQAAGHASGQFMHVGVIPLPVLDALAAEGIAPQTAVVSANDERLWHAWRSSKEQPLPLLFWRRLPEHLAHPDEIRLSPSNSAKQKDALLFVYGLPEDRGKLVVSLDYQIKARHPVTGRNEKVLTNMVNSGAIADNPDQLASLNAHKLIWKKP